MNLPEYLYLIDNESLKELLNDFEIDSGDGKDEMVFKSTRAFYKDIIDEEAAGSIGLWSRPLESVIAKYCGLDIDDSSDDIFDCLIDGFSEPPTKWERLRLEHKWNPERLKRFLKTLNKAELKLLAEYWELPGKGDAVELGGRLLKMAKTATPDQIALFLYVLEEFILKKKSRVVEIAKEMGISSDGSKEAIFDRVVDCLISLSIRSDGIIKKEDMSSKYPD